MNHYKDPFKPTSIIESKSFFFVAQVCKSGMVICILVFWQVHVIGLSHHSAPVEVQMMDKSLVLRT